MSCVLQCATPLPKSSIDNYQFKQVWDRVQYFFNKFSKQCKIKYYPSRVANIDSAC